MASEVLARELRKLGRDLARLHQVARQHLLQREDTMMSAPRLSLPRNQIATLAARLRRGRIQDDRSKVRSMNIQTLSAAQSPHCSLASALRVLAMDAVEKANSGHPGAPMGMAEAATVLFRNHLKFDAANPDWPDRDRFVLSNGHASMLLYGLLHLTGYPDMTLDQIMSFRQWGSIAAGHPEYGHAKGVETTTGPLGQGLATAVGMALAERRLAAEFGKDVVDHYTYVFAGDGCLQEGIGQEAISLAGHLGLGKLILCYDDNSITIDGPTSVSFSEDVPARFRA